MTTTVENPEDLVDMVGTELGASDWVEIDQARINLFADATDDHQWIHVDPQRAADGPFGRTIAHGYLTLSLLVPMMQVVLDCAMETAGGDRPVCVARVILRHLS